MLIAAVRWAYASVIQAAPTPAPITETRSASPGPLAVAVPVIDAEGRAFTLSAQALLGQAWATSALREARRGNPYAREMPRLVVRRGNRRAASQTPERLALAAPIRARGTMSGHAKTELGEIVLSVGPRLGHEWLRAVVVHEAAHIACGHDAAHGPAWRSTYLQAAAELYPAVRSVRLTRQASWKLDDQIAEAIALGWPSGRAE